MRSTFLDSVLSSCSSQLTLEISRACLVQNSVSVARTLLQWQFLLEAFSEDPLRAVGCLSPEPWEAYDGGGQLR